jgi:hypothetical protein
VELTERNRWQSSSPIAGAQGKRCGPVNFALVTGILLTRQPLEFERVEAVYHQRLARFARFRQRVVESGFPVATPYSEDMPD